MREALRKKRPTRFGGSIIKSAKLTAIEKRRRMIEAGKKYAALNGITLHVGVTQQPEQKDQGDAKCANFSSLITEQKAMGLDKIDSSNIAKEDSAENDVKKDSIKGIHRPNELHGLRPPPSAPSTRYQHARSGKTSSIPQSAPSNRHKPPNTHFEKDASSLRDIMNQRPITQVIGRPSHTRQRERLSLFPNGINPLDETAVRILPPLASPRDSNTCSTYLRPVDTPGVISSLETPLACGVRSSCKKTPASKSVHFNDNIAFRSPSISSLEKHQPSDVLRLNVSDEELDTQLCSLPFGTIMRLKDALHRITMTRSAIREGETSLGSEELQRVKEDSPKETEERGNRWKRQTRSKKLVEAGSWSASKLQAVTEEESCTTRMLTRSAGSVQTMVLTSAPRGKDRKVLSQVYADQEVMILTSRTKGKRFNDTNGRPADPLVSLFGTPENVSNSCWKVTHWNGRG
uniref:Proline-rich protein 36-like n=1 Tax=Ascaris lumbricoides TaxID=6252 RepID=A0A0M3IKA0_ASCLU